MQIIHIDDFAFWKMPEKIEEQQSNFDYPPRLQIQCVQNDTSKSLYCTFEISKTHNMVNEVIADFVIIKKAAGKRKIIKTSGTIFLINSN